MISFDKFLQKQYISDKYNCWDFALEVWSDLTNKPTPHTSTNADDSAPELHKLALLTAHKDFVTLPAPVTPCFVLMQRQRLAPHIGVYINGKVLHMNSRGASYAELHHVTAPFPTVTFHAPK